VVVEPASAAKEEPVTQVNVAHVAIQGVDCAIFDADSRSHANTPRQELLAALTVRARASGLRVEKAALAYAQGGRIEFYGTRDLVRYLARNGLPGGLTLLA
jgi:hypothetical protein